MLIVATGIATLMAPLPVGLKFFIVLILVICTIWFFFRGNPKVKKQWKLWHEMYGVEIPKDDIYSDEFKGKNWAKGFARFNDVLIKVWVLAGKEGFSIHKAYDINYPLLLISWEVISSIEEINFYIGNQKQVSLEVSLTKENLDTIIVLPRPKEGFWRKESGSSSQGKESLPPGVNAEP